MESMPPGSERTPWDYHFYHLENQFRANCCKICHGTSIRFLKERENVPMFVKGEGESS